MIQLELTEDQLKELIRIAVPNKRVSKVTSRKLCKALDRHWTIEDKGHNPSTPL